jgi:two-component system, sensor histidine kinase and response regulator
VRRLGGREALVLEVLHGMLRQYDDVPAVVRAHLAANRADDARIAAHTLKGLAATAGCMRLSTAARELELAIKAGGSVEGLLTELGAALDQVRASAAQIPANAAKARVARAGPIDLAVELPRLATLLRTSDSAAQEQFELVRPSLAARVPGEVLDPIGRAIQVFDFETASMLLEALPLPTLREGHSAATRR